MNRPETMDWHRWTRAAPRMILNRLIWGKKSHSQAYWKNFSTPQAFIFYGIYGSGTRRSIEIRYTVIFLQHLPLAFEKRMAGRKKFKPTLRSRTRPPQSAYGIDNQPYVISPCQDFIAYDNLCRVVLPNRVCSSSRKHPPDHDRHPEQP